MLKEIIEESGISVTAIARKMGITREGLYKKLNNKTEFKASEIVLMQKILSLSNKKRDEIFFAKKVE
jgi:DNA-binding phage protein